MTYKYENERHPYEHIVAAIMREAKATGHTAEEILDEIMLEIQERGDLYV